jgi:DNA-directed RNA polymerase subunit RPC12/RpoP
MNLRVIKQLNKTTRLEIEFTDERDLKEALLKATPFMQIPYKCGKCGSDNVVFQARRTKEGDYIYPEVFCFDCRAKRPMGEYKNPKGALFFKKWEDPFNGSTSPDSGGEIMEE